MTDAPLGFRIGFEIELLAPPGSSRRTLAGELARRAGSSVRPVWHHDSEPSLVPGLGQFRHLSQGFEVRDAAGAPVCTLVDDVTITADLDPRAAPAPGWYRVLTDDPRLLHLLARTCSPEAVLGEVLDPAAELWQAPVERHGAVHRLSDERGATVALAAPQGGERERPCEIVTPPISDRHGERLDELLCMAAKLGFTVPLESAVHLHLDGAPFRAGAALANVIRLFGHWRAALHDVLDTNPHCRRLAPLPEAMVGLTTGTPSFAELRQAATETGLTKFHDVNLTQLFAERPIRDTIEIRILPGAIDAGEIVERARIVEGLLRRCLEPEPIPVPPADPAQAATQVRRLGGLTA